MQNNKKAELLLNHYNDTYQHILYHWKARNRLFVFILIILALIALDTYSPGVLSDLVNAYIAKILNLSEQTPKTLDFHVIGSVAWFLLLSLIIQYYQRSIHVDRQYRYIHNLENQLCDIMGDQYITREGKSYLSKTGVATESGSRPLFLKAVGCLYIIFFPMLLVGFIFYKIFSKGFCFTDVTDYLNLVIQIAILLYNAFYMIWIWRDLNWKKKQLVKNAG